MRIAVTGAAGGLGSAVRSDLHEHGYDVVGVDRIEAAGTLPWDGRDVGVLRKAIQGCTGLVHLAAIPHPNDDPPQVVFGNNTTATFAALQAAADVGITSAAIASSGSAYGTAFSPQPSVPRYVPVDEQHPLDAADPYALSKEVDERTAEMFTRRYPMSVAALRFHWIADREDQLAAVAQARTEVIDGDRVRGLWGYVDRRDAARACRLAVETGLREPYGFVALNIVAADILSEIPLAELLARHATTIEVREGLGAGAFAVDRAAEVIGWRPEHSWRDAH